MSRALRILVVEDNPDDAELVLMELRRAAYDPLWHRVDNEQSFLEHLHSGFDIILSDYDMPGFSGPRALELLQQSGVDIPFIIISGTIGEDVAVDVMKQGANDYLIKDRLARLGLAVAQAIEQGQLRRDRAMAIAALQKSEHELRELAAQLEMERSRLSAAQTVAKMGSWDTDLSTLVVIWSTETYRIFELTPDQFQPTHPDFLQLVHPEDREAVARAFLQSLSLRSVNSIEHRLLMPDGRIKFVEEHWQVFHDEQDRPLRALGTCRDITERKVTEEELRWKTAFLEAQVNSSIDGILVVDQQGRKIQQNQQMGDLLKIPPDIANASDDSEQLQWVTNAVVDSKTFVEKVHYLYAHPDEIGRDEIEMKDGSVFDRYSSPVIGKDSRYYGRIWTFRDITERKRAATALLESGRFLQSALNALTSHIAILDEHGTIIEVNAAWKRFATENNFRGSRHGVGDNYLQLCDSATGRYSDEAARVAAGIRAVMSGQSHEFQLEYPCHSPTEERWFVVRVTLFGGNGPLRTVVAHENVTQRRRAEAAMRESEERFRQLAEHIQEVFWITDVTKHHMLYVSPAYETIWGRPCKSLYTSPQEWLDSIHPDDRERVMTAATTRQQIGDYEEEYRILRPDGTLRWIRDRAFPVRNTQGEVYRVVGLAQDITERRQASDQLREQATLLDKAQDAILVRDLDHHVLYWNHSAERLYGWTAAEAMGRSIVGLVYRNPTDFEASTEIVLNKGEWVGEIQQWAKDGRPLTVEGRWTLVRDDQGKPKSILSINTDITERKKLEHQFLRAQRMESIGTLAGGIAHDLNNVLTPILMSIELLANNESDPRRIGVLATIERCAQRGAEMIDQVLTFARGIGGQRLRVRVDHLLSEIETFASETFSKQIILKTVIPDGLWHVMGDPTQLHQVLLNLCVNARDAMPDGGTLTLSASNLILDEQFTSVNIEAKLGPHVMIEVEDTGTGMTTEVMDRIFEPFFTTKELGKGTGLGLSTSQAIIRSHGSFILVNSEPGKGTKFSVFLPAQTTAPPDIAPTDVDLPRGKNELVLVVDDDPAVLEITRQSLEAFGYRVLLAASGKEALAIHTSRHEEIALVITDIMMAEMDGPALIEALVKTDPAVRIIAACGLNTSANTANVISSGVHCFLPKPYKSQTLLKALRDALADR